jgi:hypothetical protein
MSSFLKRAGAAELPDYRIIFVISVNLTGNTVMRLNSTGLEL